MKVAERIVSDPNICGGEACVKGTRIGVGVVLGHLAAGEEIDEVLRQFPSITREDVLACLEYGAFLASEKILPD